MTAERGRCRRFPKRVIGYHWLFRLIYSNNTVGPRCCNRLTLTIDNLSLAICQMQRCGHCCASDDSFAMRLALRKPLPKHAQTQHWCGANTQQGTTDFGQVHIFVATCLKTMDGMKLRFEAHVPKPFAVNPYGRGIPVNSETVSENRGLETNGQRGLWPQLPTNYYDPRHLCSLGSTF